MFSTFTNTCSLHKSYSKPVPVLRTLYSAVTMNCSNISADGSTIVYINSSNPANVYLSTDYGTTFTQKTSIPNGSPYSAVTGRENVVVSNGGQYIYNYKSQSTNNVNNILYSDDYGVTWVTLDSKISLVNFRAFSVNISGNGQYVCLSGDNASGGIKISNNYGASGSWTTVFSNTSTQGNYVNPTGQYMIVNMNINPPSGYIKYSSDYGVTFSNVSCQASTYGRRAYISTTGDFMLLSAAGSGTLVIYSTDKTSTFQNPSSTVTGYLNSQLTAGLDKENCFVSNDSGSSIYFTKGSVGNNLFISTDYLQTASAYLTLPTPISDGKVRGSSDGKYLLVWCSNSLRLITNP